MRIHPLTLGAFALALGVTAARVDLEVVQACAAFKAQHRSRSPVRSSISTRSQDGWLHTIE
jgi:hypothetical protein